MPKHGKKYLEAVKKVDRDSQYAADEAIALIKEVAYANFDETVEVHARLGIDPRQADQTVRTTVDLPAWHRQSRFACSFSPPVKPSASRARPAPIMPVATIWSSRSRRLARVRCRNRHGRPDGQGRWPGPDPRSPRPDAEPDAPAPLFATPEDLPGVIRELKGGRVEFRNDRTGIVHSVIGKKSFTDEQLRDNLFAFVDALKRAKPSAIKGVYCKSLSISTAMSPGITLNVNETAQSASSATA